MSEQSNASETRWEAVGADADFQEDRGVLVEVGKRQIGVYRHKGRLYALKDHCPHAGMPLHDGYVADGCVTCPWHGWTFELETGKGPGGCSVATYPVRITDDGKVEVGV